MTFFLKRWKTLASILLIFALFLAYNYKLVLSPSTALTDWLDYPLIVFILKENIQTFSQLNFSNWSMISSYYPSPNGMFFTEILVVQGIIGTLLFPFTQNYILTHNIIFFLTAFANIVSLHYFWGKLFKKQSIVSLLSALFIFSPYYFSMYVHYQMISYAFFFFSAGVLLSAEKKSHFFTAGLLSGLQFLAGVYLGMYSLTFTGIFLLWKLWNGKRLATVIKHGLLYATGFLLIAGYFVAQFSYTKQQYNIERDAGFYVDLAIQPTDFFFNPYPSLWSTTVYKYINQFNHSRAPGFSTGWFLLAASIAGVIVWNRKKLPKKQKRLGVFMIVLLLWGVLAALGPRLIVNGTYYGTPLPYWAVLKFTPIFDALRATGRWFFVIQISVLFFVGLALQQLQKKVSKKMFLVIVSSGLLLYSIEIIPLHQRTAVEAYQSYAYQPLIANCKKTDVLLEYPFGTLNPETDVGIVLNYWVKMLLNQMHHGCYIVNGYSGFDPQHFLDFRDTFETVASTGTTHDLSEHIQTKNVNYIKINKAWLTKGTPVSLVNLVHSPEFEILLEDDTYLVARKKP